LPSSRGHSSANERVDGKKEEQKTMKTRKADEGSVEVSNPVREAISAKNARRI
jgi:hypothetical protein